MMQQEVTAVKSEHVMKLMSKLWEHIPDDKKRELIENDDVTVKAIGILEKGLGIEKTILNVPEPEENGDNEEQPEEEGDSDDD